MQRLAQLMTSSQDSPDRSQEHCAQDNTGHSDSGLKMDVECDPQVFGIRKIFTLIFIHDKKHNQLLLGQKQRGALLGQWNGFGGKVERELESVAESAVRELQEEAFVQAPLFPIGFIQWIVRSKEEPTYRDVMVVYKAHSFKPMPSSEISPVFGTSSSPSTTSTTWERITEFKASDEMAPAWWDIDDLPWESMRVNHKVWYPFMLADRPYAGVYWYETTRAQVAEGTENAQRENAQEIWMEDLTKRCFQFGTRPIPETDSPLEGRKEVDEKTLEEYAGQIGLTGDCYSSLSEETDREHQMQQERRQVTFSSDPTPSGCVDEHWLQTAIASAELEWAKS